jgi:RNA polymerase sigma factor (sigma-70 family)
LFQVARRRCLDELRRQRPIHFPVAELAHAEDELSSLAAIVDPGPLPEELAEQHDFQEHLMRAIHVLPPKMRSVVFLRYTQQLSFPEIEQKLGISPTTAKTSLARARRILLERPAAVREETRLMPFDGNFFEEWIHIFEEARSA